jgi:hypothetical protein
MGPIFGNMTEVEQAEGHRKKENGGLSSHKTPAALQEKATPRGDLQTANCRWNGF